MPAVAQISEQGISIPGHRRVSLIVERIGAPVVDIAAGKLRAVAFRTQRIAWRVAGATMRQPLDQIGTAVPLGALLRIGLIGVVTKEKQLPSGNGEPLVEREGKLVFACRCADGLPRHQEGIKCPVILVADIGEVVVWKCRIKVLAFTIEAGAHRAPKRAFRPSPDSRLCIRRRSPRDSINYRRSGLQGARTAAHWWECRIWTGRAMINVNLDFLPQERLRANPDRTT